MDNEKRKQLVALVKTLGHDDMSADQVLVSREQFFDGNDDEASIGCNLDEHPGVACFDAAFRQIEAMPEVAGVYFAITELIDTEDEWPFTDTACIVSSLSAKRFDALLAPLQPSDMDSGGRRFVNPPRLPAGHRLISVWWD